MEKTMISFENVVFKYEKQSVRNELSYVFDEGKTTLLRIISGIDKKFTGYVFGGGYENVSVAFQEYRLFPQLTALENITESVWEKANENNLSDAREMLFKLGFSQEETALFPHELSGGMKQRVSLARAMAYEPSLLLIDEPFKGLDEETEKNTKEFLKQFLLGRTAILVTHSDKDFDICNEVLRLEYNDKSFFTPVLFKEKTDM